MMNQFRDAYIRQSLLDLECVDFMAQWQSLKCMASVIFYYMRNRDSTYSMAYIKDVHGFVVHRFGYIVV